MREIHVSDRGVAEAVLEALAHDVVMVQMPTVFVLLAPPTSRGVSWLDRTKSRLPAKNYGTALGDLQRFFAMARPGTLPAELASVEGFQLLTGAFIRITVAPEWFDSPMVRAGTHQGLLLEGPHRELFKAVEAGLADAAEPSIIGGHTFTAPLCTSANMSGHPDGSITSWERAYEFARDRRVPLVVRCEPTPGVLGSYPILWLQRERVRIARHGPGLEELTAALPARLFAS